MKANCTLLRKIKGRIRHLFTHEELSDLLGGGGKGVYTPPLYF